MFRSPLARSLEDAESVLIAGAGGGFDLFSGLPLYFALRDAGKTVHLASYSFSYLGGCDAIHVGNGLHRVEATTQGNDAYFPERHLATWLADAGIDTPVWCFDRQGVAALRGGYAQLVDSLGIDTVVLVDGGTDSLMRGDEAGLGTPAEDVASIVAVDELEIARKLLVCLGFGVDRFHGVCHAHFLEAVAELSRSGAYLGCFSLTPEMEEVQRYAAATEYVQQRTPGRESIVCASVLSAIEGAYGDHHRTARTRGSELWINPLMSMYWCFELAGVAERLLYADWIRDTTSHHHLSVRIDAFRSSVDARRWEPIPV